MATLVFFSGGIDSSTLALQQKESGEDVTLFTLSTGSVECEYAVRFAHKHGISQVVFDGIAIAQSILPCSQMYVGGSINECCPDDGLAPVEMSVLYMHVIGCMYAQNRGYDKVMWAIHADDIGQNIEEVMAYIDTVNALLKLSGSRLSFEVPYIDMRKKHIVEKAKEYGIDIDETYSCSAGNNNPCGECKQCKLRAKALCLVAA